MGVTKVPLTDSGGATFVEGVGVKLGPIDLISAVLPGFSTLGATLAIVVSGTAFTGMQVMGSVDGTNFYDAVDFWDGSKMTVSTGSSLYCLGMNYPWLQIQAHGGGTDSYLSATIAI